MLGNLVGGFVVILVGVTLMPTVANEVEGSQQTFYGDSSHNFVNSSITGTSATILDLTKLFFALAIMSTGIGIATTGLKAAGLV